jgi:hypothetical protein
MKKEKNLYIKILKWAFEKKESGFIWEELKEKFKLDKETEEWIKKIFLTASDADRKFFEHLKYVGKNDTHVYALNEKGISAYIDYQKLEEARDGSAKAMKIAIWSICIAIATSVAQILTQIYFK